MAAKKGSLSISSENIFPIIKKWVYSDHDIFARELVSNGCDAITKLKKLDMMGEYQLPDDYKPAIKVEVNPEEKTLKFTDNGLGMTADEVEEYITQIAFSGATQFLEKYKDKTTEDDMIGHFGLGFYDTEVAEYVFRENILLTLIGSVAGVVFGKILHLFVIQTVEVDAAMFGRSIYLKSYIYSFLFTIGFSLFVNWVMYFKLKKIDMVESLKSIE